LFNSFLPILLFLIPKFFATLNIVWGLTQHMGLQEDVRDHRLSTRSVRLNPIFSFIYWKMEYHIEHHMFPSIPSYNLPKLHDAIKHQLPKPQTLFEAYREIIPAVIKKTNDPDYYISVKLPAN
jgi:fatty acid desaturase